MNSGIGDIVLFQISPDLWRPALVVAHAPDMPNALDLKVFSHHRDTPLPDHGFLYAIPAWDGTSKLYAWKTKPVVLTSSDELS